MRDFLIFLVVLAIVFFAVGEWRGWYLGVPSSTPVFVYKKDYTSETSRRTINVDALPIRVSGRVSQGIVRVEIIYERPSSFQQGTRGEAAEQIFEEVYRQGQSIAINEVFDAGGGIYTIVLHFEEATGLFRLRLPPSSQL